ncbi:MAG: hypothetical protein HLUCCX10_13765 [Algoriphagus marincola HL-49]|uniref:Uncharacterized protein n=1 Tax=Algoriphagus marincola HL-49 TaxID=1305737 RepID=A0A0P8A628_9BACT|nr:MAG: hypothetical protein HLUCCX10_13765 [Algoriphagus marincola HL-49]
MRKLTDKELQAIQDSIRKKVLSSAEIIMEIYDHYVSHLQEYPKEEFEKQLLELDQKFTYSYCHRLQFELNNYVRTDIGKTQWMVIKKYFCFSRWLYLAGILAILFYVASLAKSEKELKLLFFSPLVLLIAMFIFLGVQWLRKILPIRKLFKGNGVSIESSFSKQFILRIHLPLSLINFIFYVPGFFPENIYSFLSSPSTIALITAIFVLYVISLLEVWKIKSKTALL